MEEYRAMRGRFTSDMTVEVKASPSKLQQQLPQPPSPITRISLKFRVQVKCRHFIVPDRNNSNLSNLIELPLSRHRFRILPFQVFYVPIRVVKERDNRALQRFLSIEFETCPVDVLDVKVITNAIKDKWVEIQEDENSSSSTFGRVFPLTITIKLSTIVTYYERQWFEWNHEMVPTSKPAIKAMVKRVKREDIEEGQSCTICLEEIKMEENRVIMQMPCMHVFHRNCIHLWLEKSHYCPICRFEMPIDY